MAKVTAGDKYQVTIICRQGGQNGLNVRYVKVDTVSNPDCNEQDFANTLSAVFGAVIKPLLSEKAQYRGLTLRSIGNIGEERIAATNESGNGAVTGDPLPPQICGLISLYGRGPKRKNHGRVYIPFPSETDSVATGGVSTAYGSNADNYGNLFVGPKEYAVGATDTDIAARWFIAGNQGQGDPIFITSKRTRGFWATQRRRGFLGRSDLVIV